MRLRRFILVLLSIFCVYRSAAQSDLAQSRILILLDRSSSMVQSWAGGKEKYKAADDMILKLVDSLYAINPEVEVGLRVFGHQYSADVNNCYDTKMEVLFSKDVRTQMALRLSDIHPFGVTPISYALEQAARYDIVNESKNAYCIVLITDGGESCGGDICGVMEKFLKNRVHFRPYIVSLEDYAPLKATYSCMGDYLQVLKQGDIRPAVGTIIDAFRPILKISNADYKEMQKANIPTVLKVNNPVIKIPEPKVVDTPIKIPVKEKIVFTKPPPNEKIPFYVVDRNKLFAVRPPDPVKLQPIEQPELPAFVADNIPEAPVTRLQPIRLRNFTVSPPPPPQMETKDAGITVTMIWDVPRDKEATVAKLIPAKPRPFNVIFVIEDKVFAPHALPALPAVVYETPTVVVAPPPPTPAAKPEKKPVKEPKKSEFKTETEDAPETTVEIYFTNGKGKFYNSTPQVQLLDPGTNQLVKKFYRTLDENGNPDPQQHILPGRYDIAFTESKGVTTKNVEVVAGKRNKIYVTVNNTSLSFSFHGAPGRPVKEFTAIVTERNKNQGRVQSQKCTELIEYEPGNYHVVINTFPEDVRNVDLDFNETEIEILQPGFAKFTNPIAAHGATLWKRYGDKFMQFYSLDLNDPRNQHLQIQPGEYQIHYQKGPGQKAMSEKVMPFLIKATEETEVVLK